MSEFLRRQLWVKGRASWIDLPDSVTHLRYVPEMIVAMLAQQQGEYVCPDPEGRRTWFAVGKESTQ